METKSEYIVVKCRGVFKGGYGSWEYVEVPINQSKSIEAQKKDIEELLYMTINSDPEGLRPIQYEILNKYPVEFLQERIDDCEINFRYYKNELKRYKAKLKEIE